jgi:hypothetical protein
MLWYNYDGWMFFVSRPKAEELCYFEGFSQVYKGNIQVFNYQREYHFSH